LYGYSQESSVGNGAVILTYPDPPINLVETVSERSASSISFTWSNGVADGGTPVLDYRITYDQSTGDYVILSSGVHSTSFTAIGLKTGNTYKFRVESRNKFGYSGYS
jgi:hypothetical protein